MAVKSLHFIFDGALYKQIDDFWVWSFWVGLLSSVLYNFHLRIIDPFLSTRENIHYFGNFPDFITLFQRHVIFYNYRDQIVSL